MSEDNPLTPSSDSLFNETTIVSESWFREWSKFRWQYTSVFLHKLLISWIVFECFVPMSGLFRMATDAKCLQIFRVVKFRPPFMVCIKEVPVVFKVNSALLTCPMCIFAASWGTFPPSLWWVIKRSFRKFYLIWFFIVTKSFKPVFKWKLLWISRKHPFTVLCF